MSSYGSTSSDSISKVTDESQSSSSAEDVRAERIESTPMDRTPGTFQELNPLQGPGQGESGNPTVVNVSHATNVYNITDGTVIHQQLSSQSSTLQTELEARKRHDDELILGSQQGKMKDFTALTGSVKLFKNNPIHEGKKIYKGEKTTAAESVPVVVKLIEYSKKARREAESLHSMEVHPNVVRIYDSGTFKADIKYVFIAMELCSKETLDNYITKNNFSLQMALQHSTQIISGLRYIHSKNIVHRDLKPDNVLFSLKDGYDQVKITDFGVSKNYVTDPQASSRPFGTVGYVAPEIINSENLSDPTKCDIFSLGVLLAFLLSKGKHPYGDQPWQWNFNIAAGKDPDLSGILLPDGDQRDAVIRIILSMLQRKPDNRPTAEDALKIWLNNVVDSEEDVGLGYRPKRRKIGALKKIQTPCIIGVTQLDKQFNTCNELICWNSIEEMKYEPTIALDMPEVGNLSYTIFGHKRNFYLLSSDKSCRILNLDDVTKGLEQVDSMKHDHGMRPHATFLNGKLYVCGSRRNRGGQTSKKCEVFDKQWTDIADMNQARNLNCVVSYKGCLYAVGGLDEEGNPLSSVEKYDPTKKKWEFIASLNVARSAPYAIVHNEKIYVLRGSDKNNEWIPSFECFDSTTSTWTVSSFSWWETNKPVFPFVFKNKVFCVLYSGVPGYRNIQQVPFDEAEKDLLTVLLPERSKLYRINSVE